MSDLRDDIEKIFDTTETEETGRPQADTEIAVRDTPEATTTQGEPAPAEGLVAKVKAEAKIKAMENLS